MRLLLVLPGLWLGGVVAPWMNKVGGASCNLGFTAATALGVGTLVLCLGQVNFLHTQFASDVQVYGSASPSLPSSSSGESLSEGVLTLIV